MFVAMSSQWVISRWDVLLIGISISMLTRPKLPNVEAWYQRLSERPAYRKHVMRHFGENPEQWAALEKASASEGKI